MDSRHLVLSDLHENGDALERFIDIAQKKHGGFDSVWFLGDIFGHSLDSIGQSDLRQNFINNVQKYLTTDSVTICGNWEYWLGHPEMDTENRNQRRYEFQLGQRRAILSRKQNKKILERILPNTILKISDFTLFHGCSYTCHGNSEYKLQPWECYLFPRDLNIVTRGLFGNRRHLETPHFLFGHTHVPGWFSYSNSTMTNMWRYLTRDMIGKPISYADRNLRFGINPGSAGVYRFRVPRTALLLDTGEKTFTYLADEEDS